MHHPCDGGHFEEGTEVFRNAIHDIGQVCAISPWYRDNWAGLRYAYKEFVNQLTQSGRTSDAKQAARQMSEWVQRVSTQLPDESVPQNELLSTAIQAAEAMQLTDQASEAKVLSRELIRMDCRR